MLKLCLIFAALLGLAAEGTAIAATQPSVHEAVAAMTEDCIKMMAEHEDKKSSPCDGSFKCMLAMGCLSVNMIPEAGDASVGEPSMTTPEYWSAVVALQGTSYPPETDPPTTFD